MDRLLTLRFLSRLSSARNSVTKQFHSSAKLLNAQDSSSSSDSSDSDAEKPKEKVKESVIMKRHRDEVGKQQTVDLLNDLLAKMNEEKLVNRTIDLAVPVKKPVVKKVREKTLEEKLKVAAKEVAESLGGDVQQKEDELLDKIFSAGVPAPPPVVPFKVPPKKSKKKKKLAKIPQDQQQPGEKEAATPEPEKIVDKKEDLSALIAKEKEEPEISLSELLAAMKIDRTPKRPSGDVDTFTRATKMRQIAQRFQPKFDRQNTERFAARSRMEVPGDLYAGSSSKILSGSPNPQQSIILQLDTWNALQEQELKSMISHPPQNYFEEMIQWTERGILWKFPIDNEQGMEAEQSVHFSEHVFLEQHLDWCPPKGPIRHFMELVCTGLSKNPYMTVAEKKEHIIWFRDYFGDKQELLKEIGAIERDILPGGATAKQIEG